MRRKPSTDNCFDFSIGSSACIIRLWQIRQRNELGTAIYIHNDKKLFRRLRDNKAAIESDAGLIFDWCELPERKASRITVSKAVDFDDKTARREQFDWLIDTMLKLKKNFARYL